MPGALPRQGILIFDRGFASGTVSLATAGHIKFRDLPMEAGQRLRLENSFMRCSIQAMPTAAESFV
jgi:hypothetical protein